MRQQFVDSAGGLGGQSLEHVMEDNISAGIRRRRGETLGQLLERLDATLARALASPVGYIDEINDA